MVEVYSRALQGTKSLHWRSFWLGAIAGVFCLVGLGGLCELLAKPQLRFALTGADVTARGGTTITITDAGDRWFQTCNGTCDDVSHIAKSVVPPLGIRITDGARRCLVCETDIYIEPSAPIALNVAGATKLGLTYRPWHP